MTLLELKIKYPNFRYGNDSKGGNEYIFTINDLCEKETDIDSRKFTDVTLTVSCEIEELLNDKNFIKWLDELWQNEMNRD